MKQYVIVGNGTAAVGCIEGIRSVDPEGEITVISEERHPVYSRPLISYLLEGKTDLQRMRYRAGDFYEQNKCKVIYGRCAESVRATEKTVLLVDGTSLSYDRLCVATGSRPFVPPFEGLETVRDPHTFMTLDDALSLDAALTGDPRVLIVGAGLIGLKCAEGIRDRAGSVTVCDLADRVLSSILDPDCAALVQDHLERNGIRFLLGDTVQRFEERRAYLKSGTEVEFDLLVLAVGVRANTELVKNAGGEVNRGILVNERMETTIPDVYAAGDCAEGYDAALGAHRVLAILPNAYLQGSAAGANMAGNAVSFNNAIPMNSIGFFGLHMMTAGVYEGEMVEERTEGSIKRFFVGNGFLKGFILIGGTERAGIYTSLIREKVPLDTIDFALTKKIASNLIFSREICRKKFGGVV